MLVKVRENKVEQALRVLKRKMQAEGILKEVRSREYYEKPSEKRRREANESKRRAARNRSKADDADRR